MMHKELTCLCVRWLRQPLLDLAEIERRMDVVEAFLLNTRTRNEIRDGPLKGMPDLDLVLTRFVLNIEICFQ
jgi:DNA mismatch repair protein MSH2